MLLRFEMTATQRWVRSKRIKFGTYWPTVDHLGREPKRIWTILQTWDA